MSQSILTWIQERLQQKKLLFALLDPDRSQPESFRVTARRAEDTGVDALMVGSSAMISSEIDSIIRLVKESVKLPVILFPGDVTQLSQHADALFLLSLLSGRNPQYLISEHVKAAPIIRRYGLEAMPTAYLLIESGGMTSVQFVSGTMPIPRQKPDLAAAHALAGEYMGMQLVYLEAGSGAKQPVPVEVIREVRASVKLPLVVGGGIRNPETARQMYAAGADILVVGNFLESHEGLKKLQDMTAVVSSL